MTKTGLFWKELLFFGLAQAIGVAAAYRYFNILELRQLMAEADWSFSFYDILILSLFLIVFLFLIAKRNRASRIFFKVFFWIIIFSGSQMVFSAFFTDFYSLVFAAALIFVMAKFRQVWLQNLGVVLGIAGIGAAVGLSLSPLAAVVVLVALSFYDIIAVYFTGHMIKMAESMIKSRAIFGLIIPDKTSGFNEKVQNIEPGDKFMILGSGDVALPLVLAVSLVGISIWQAAFVASFACLGLFITHNLFTSQEKRRPMAALPPIAMMAIVGYLISSLLL